MRSVSFACLATLALWGAPASGDELKSGPEKRYGGSFTVEAITGANKGKSLCYVWKYNGEARPAVVIIFTQKADDNLASLVKAIDAVQSKNADLGTVVVGISGVQATDFEKLQTTHKLTTPLAIAEDKDGPDRYKLNKEAAITVVIYRRGGAIEKNFAFKDTKSASEKAKEITEVLNETLKKTAKDEDK